MQQISSLKKLSEALGISISTVSRALKNHPDIAEKTKRKVKELADALEYEPNSYAVQLRTKQSNVLGILVPTIDNFFYDTFIAAVEEEARLHGYSVIIVQSKEKAALEKNNLHLLRKSMVTGLFVSVSVETEDMTPFEKFRELKIPVIFIDRVPQEPGYKKVCLSDADAARIAAETIIKSKKKKVLALFGHPHLSISKIRSDVFRKTFKAKAPKTKVICEYPEKIVESDIVATRYLKEKFPPDVIFCMGDMILIGTMYAIHEMGLKVPDDIAVISISNGLIPTLYHPKITYVETSGAKLGRLAFSKMLLALHNEPLPDETFVESILVKGGSI